MLLSPPALGRCPEEVQLVTVRDRHWFVRSVTVSSLPVDVMSPRHSLQHLVELSSVEDDGLGDERSARSWPHFSRRHP